MASPYHHYLNWKNSCAIDSFLELAQFTFFKDLEHVEKGPFLRQVYNSCCSRSSNTQPSLSKLREGPWQWLQQNAQSFAGCTRNASFEDILDVICCKDGEKQVFGTLDYREWKCSLCSTSRVQERTLFPVYISNDECLAKCKFDIESYLNDLLYSPHERSKTCHSCNAKTCMIVANNVVLPKYLFIRLPNMAAEEGTEPKVLGGVKVSESIILNGNSRYHLCGAVKGSDRHFSVTVQHNGRFYHIDDTSLEVKDAERFASLAGQGEVLHYTTTATDGYYVFVYKLVEDATVADIYAEQITSTPKQKSPATSTPKETGYISAEHSTCVDSKVEYSDNEKSDVFEFGCVTTNRYSLLTDETIGLNSTNSDQSQPTHMTSTPKRKSPATVIINETCDSSDIFYSNLSIISKSCDSSGHNLKSSPKRQKSSVHVDNDHTPPVSSHFSQAHPTLHTPLETQAGALTKVHNDEPIDSKKEFISTESGTYLYTGPFSDITNTKYIPKHTVTEMTSAGSCVDNNYPNCMSPDIQFVKERPFISLKYVSLALSPNHANQDLKLSTLKKKNIKCALNNSEEMYPESCPKYISVKAFLYHAFRGIDDSCKTIRTKIFKAFSEMLKENASSTPSVAGIRLVDVSDENDNCIYLCLDDFYSLCDLHGKEKRYRPLKRVASRYGLTFENEVIGNHLNSNKVTHVSINLLLSYLFSAVGNKYLKFSEKMQLALDEIILMIESANWLVQVLPRLPVQVANYESSTQFQSTKIAATKKHAEKKNQCSSELLQDNTSNASRKKLGRRVKKQEDALKMISKEIHHGGKESLKLGITYSVTKAERNRANETRDGVMEEWSGSLNVADLLDILNGIPSKTPEKSALEEYVARYASQIFHLDARSLIDLVDNLNSNNIINELRKKLPNFFDSSKKVQDELTSLEAEFNLVMKPVRTSSGYRVDASALLKCLRYLYYFLPKDNQLWKIWVDAREIGGKKSCCFAVSCINNELKLFDAKYHSPKEIWPICLLYGGDGRWNLESNIGQDAGKPGWLNDWIASEQSDFVKFFLSGDSMFLDAVHGKHGELAPNSKNSYNLYSCDHISSAHEIGPSTGLRSELQKGFTREIPNSLIPSIPLERTVFCLDHATTRIVEKLIQLRVKSIVSNAQCLKDNTHRKHEVSLKLSKLKKNMIDRLVYKAERLALNPDGSIVEKLTLNKRDAHSLLLEPTVDGERRFSALLEGVAMNTVMFKVDNVIQGLLSWPNEISEYDLETAMWTHLSKVIFMLRNSDSDPKLKPGKNSDSSDADSSDVDDYSWGLCEEEIIACVKNLDIFHKLFVTRYGGNSLTPYMIKLVDYTPVFLRRLPISSLMRFSTEGGEHLHYMDSCFYFQHTQRGGSYKTKDPLYSILLHRYRILQKRLIDYANDDDCDKSRAGKAFLKFVESETCSSQSHPDQREGSSVPSNSVLQQPLYNFIFVGRVPANIIKSMHCKTKDDVVTALESTKSRVLDIQPAQLPKSYEDVKMVVLTEQTVCDSRKPPETLCKALQRQWPILSCSFIPAYISNPFVDKEQFRLELTNLRQNSSIPPKLSEKVGKEYYFKERGPLHPVTQFKKKVRKSKPKARKTKKLKGQGSGYARFVAQQSRSKLKSKSWKEVQRELSEQWRLLSAKEKESFQSLASSIFSQNEQSKKQQHNRNYVPAYLS